MRIIHAIDNYPPAIGGGERSVQTLSRLQVARGDAVTVVTAARADAPRHEIDEAGVEVVRLPFTFKGIPGVYKDPRHYVFLPPAPDPVVMWHFARLLRRGRPDIVHTHGWIHFSVCSVASRAGVPVIATAHDYGFACARKTMYRHGEICDGPGRGKCIECASEHYGVKGVAIAVGLRASGRLGRQVDGWTGLSRAVTECGSAPRPVDRTPMAIIPSYVPDGLGQGPGLTERPRYAPADGPYIMFAGALSEHKGVRVLLRAHERLRDSGHEVPLVLVGVPGDVIAGAEPSPPGVIVAPSAPHGEVMKGWRHAEIGVAPSIWGEPFGQVAVECLAVGTPLVASRVGGLTDIVEDEVSGLLVEPGDDSALFRTIRRLLGDAGLRRRLGTAGALRAREFMVSAVLPRIDGAYADAIGARAARLCPTMSGPTTSGPA